MIDIQVLISDEVICDIVRHHINNKTIDLINWHTALKEPSAFLPYGFSDSESEEIIKKLKEAIHTQEIIELNDYRLQFALSCILEEEERVTDESQELSAEFSYNDRRELEKYLPEEVIKYYENYDHFRDLLIPNSSYLDEAMKNGAAHA